MISRLILFSGTPTLVLCDASALCANKDVNEQSQQRNKGKGKENEELTRL